jgi:hypothetical protein
MMEGSESWIRIREAQNLQIRTRLRIQNTGRNNGYLTIAVYVILFIFGVAIL